MVAGTCLAGDADDLLRGLVNTFHFMHKRRERDLDRRAQTIKRIIRERDFSEVQDEQLQCAQIEVEKLEQRERAIEEFRDIAAEIHDTMTGAVWTPPSGSRVSRNTTTAAVLEAKEWLHARQRRKDRQIAHDGPVVLFSGSTEYINVEAVWSKLDRIHRRHPDMVLVHTGWDKGGDKIAVDWAAHRGVPSVAFKPDWKRYPKHVAPFKRLDAMIAIEGAIGAVYTAVMNPGQEGVLEAFMRKIAEAKIPPTRCAA